ncbi:ATPase domain-containing protein [Maioricimonas sp. JC845]|uniref:RAD55 family ATPase n=1 Tax=Maioricimonas sp. JC845 TaxID=3232138 RepID=UPI00345989F9
MADATRIRTGIDTLDNMLGGGLLPGTLTVVMGATGIGKTQLGLQFAHQGQQQEGETGVFFDMTSRGDAQNHRDYAERLFDWPLTAIPPAIEGPLTDVWTREKGRFDICHIFDRAGKRVSVRDLDPDELREWKSELNRKLLHTIRFFYGNFVHGVRRCVIDGIEPIERASESIQFELFEYIYHQILRKESDWVARDLFRAQFRSQSEQVADHAYDHRQIACLMLYTSHEVMLDGLLSRPIESGDVLSNANTIIYMGKVRDGMRMGRALHVAKHRGSACDDAIVPFDITDQGIVLQG